MAEGEALWADINDTAARFRASAPEGMTVRISIETVDESYEPLVLQRQPPWVVFEIGEPDDQEAREIVYVREDDIRRVRLRRERGDKQIGFTLGPVVPE